MATSSPGGDVYAETLAVFDREAAPGEPLTTPEVASALDRERRTVYKRLERLVERGDLETKKAGARARVWWQPQPATADRERERYEQVVETVGDGIYVVDDEGRFTMVNDRYVEMADEPRSALLGAPVSSVVDEEVASTARELEQRLREGEAETVSLEAELPRGEDPTVAEATFSLLPTGEGYERVAVVRDVTDRVERERELEETKADLEAERQFVETALDQLDDVFYVLDTQNQLVRWNERLPALSGYSDEELDGMSVFDLLPEGDHELVIEAIAGVSDGSPQSNPETALVRKDGSRIPVSVNGSVLTDSDGTEIGIVGTARDISTRLERERELERYEVLFEESTDVNAVMDREGQFSYLTPSVEPVLGYDREALVGEDAFAYVHPDDREAIAETYTELVDGAPRGEPIEFRFRRADGSWAVLEAGARNLLEDPTIEAIVVYTREVTERVERERELERRVRQQEAVADLGRLALETGDLDELFDATVARVASALDHEYCKVLDLAPSEDELRLRSGVGWDAGIVGNATVGTDRESQAGHTLASEEPVVVTDLASETRFSGLDLLVDHDVTSGISMVIGPTADPWGVLGTHDTASHEYAPQDVAFVHSVANVLATAIERRRRERERERHRVQLRALNNLNAVVQDITEAVVEESRREEIERTVCERLASSDSYEFAWICEVDPATREVQPRVEAGVDGYLDEIPLSTDPDDPAGQGPFGRAVRTHETQVTADAHSDPTFEPWREYAEAYGYRSSVAVPIVHEEAMYGVLGVYSARPGAFAGEEGDILAQLGPLVGHSIAAVDRKRALTSDHVIELTFELRDVVGEERLDSPGDGTVTIERTVDLGDGSHLAYGTATGEGLETIRSGVAAEGSPQWTDLTVIDTDDDATTFRLRLDDSPLFSLVASHGGYVDGATIADRDLRLTVHLAPTVDVRRFVQALQETYPDIVPTTRRQITRPDESVHPVREVLVDELTDRQRAVLEAAYQAGFFDWPRLRSGEEVAESVGITPSTFHQHLRKAERKVFDRLFEAA